MTFSKTAVVTGASTGIGYSTTAVLAKKGFHVFAAVRRQEDADRVQSSLGSNVSPILMDVTDQATVYSAAAEVERSLNGATLFGLVNNAGVAIAGPLMHQPLEEFRRQIDVNLIGPLIVTQAFLPLLGARAEKAAKPGRIVNITSVAGRLAAPFVGAYAASKHGMEGLSQALRRELMVYGIDVVVIAPGHVVTPIWDKAESANIDSLKGTAYESAARKFGAHFIREARTEGLKPEVIGDAVYRALTAAKPRARITLLNKKLLRFTIPSMLPTRLVDRIIAHRLGLKQQA